MTYIREATQREYQKIRNECFNITRDSNLCGFTRVDFVDYSKYLDELREEFPHLNFEMKDYGLQVDRRE